jgi:hypothetical protein
MPDYSGSARARSCLRRRYLESGVPIIRPRNVPMETTCVVATSNGRPAVRGYERLKCRPDCLLDISQVSAVMFAELIDQHAVE